MKIILRLRKEEEGNQDNQWPADTGERVPLDGWDGGGGIHRANVWRSPGLRPVRPYCRPLLCWVQCVSFIILNRKQAFRKSGSQLQVSLGDHDWSQGSEADSFKRAVSQVKMYPSYGQGAQFNNDVCLLKLTEPLSFPAHPHVRPICLPETSSNTYANQMAAVAGWGKTGSGNSISTVLLETDLRVWPQEC